MNVLIVETTKVFRKLLSSSVEGRHGTAHVVPTGHEALEALRKQEFDLVLIPRHMPDIDGASLLREIRRHEKHVLVPIALITADDDPGLRGTSLRLGFTEVLSKADLGELDRALGDLMLSVRAQAKGKILCVEDSRTLAEQMQTWLEQQHMVVDVVSTGAEALRVFEAHNYDLVITDITLSDAISGLEVVRSIKSRADDKRLVPILAVSGTTDDARLKILQLGANDFVSKPIQHAEFIVRSRNLISMKKLYDEVLSQQKQLYSLAMTDHLTQLHNRHSLHEFASKMLSEAFRHNVPVVLMVIDLDHFKRINDVHGHDKGDLVLREVGACLKESFRTEDVVARFGGEEFVALCSHCALSDGIAKAEFIRTKLEKLKPGGFDVSASIGVTATPGGQRANFETLFKRADEAVYAAKGAGRNQVAAARVI
jgi:two-component system, cell cycle response regulator